MKLTILTAWLVLGTGLGQTIDLSGDTSPMVAGPSPWDAGFELAIGSTGVGSMRIADGAVVSSETAVLGRSVGSFGSVTVSGPGSQWISRSQLMLGLSGKADVLVEMGGSLLTSSLNSFLGANSSTTVRVSGPGSTLVAESSIVLQGLGGTHVIAENGGRIRTGSFFINGSDSESARLTVRGEGSEYSDETGINGRHGVSILVEDGGTFKSQLLFFSGSSTDRPSQLVVRGAGSSASIQSGISVGGDSITVEDGGTLNTRSISAGFSGSSTSKLVISGQDSTLVDTGGISFFGPATVLIDDGGNLQTNSIAFFDGSQTLTIKEGGVLQTKSIAFFSGSQTFMFDDGTLRSDGFLSLDAFSGGARLAIQSGGATFDAQSARIDVNIPIDGPGGLTKTGDGDLNLTKINRYRGGTVVRSGGLEIGRSISHPDAALTIAAQSGDDATVVFGKRTRVIADEVVIGSEFGSFGTLNVADGSLKAHSRVVVGDGGRGSVTFFDGRITTAGGIVASQDGSSGEVNMEFGSWKNSEGLTIGRSGNGVLNLDSGRVGADKVRLAENPGSTGTIQFGSGGAAAGVLNTRSITGGAGTARIVFEQAMCDFYLTSNAGPNGTPIRLAGSTHLVQSGTGRTTLTRDNSFTGRTNIDAGIVRTTATRALGVGRVHLNGGALDPSGRLQLNTLRWFDGTTQVEIGTDLLSIQKSLHLDGLAEFDFSLASNAMPNTDYAILSAENLSQFDPSSAFAGNSLFGIDPTFSIANDTLFVRFSGAESGPILDNRAPIYTPVDADFLVEGTAMTGGETNDNMVNSLTFADASSLTINNTLVITSGTVDVSTGSAQILGDTLATPKNFTKSGNGSLVLDSELMVGGIAELDSGSTEINGSLFADSLAVGGETFTLNGLASITGLTTLANRTSLVNGSLVSTNGIIVRSGTNLTGSGVLVGDVLNEGQINPGNSPGTLTIDGNFTQAASGNLEIEIASPSEFDRLIVSETANLSGSLTVSDPNTVLRYGDQFLIIDAEEITGAFDSIVLPSPDQIRGRLLADGTLVVAPTSYTLVADSPNQAAVAAALDTFIPATSGDQAEISTALDQLTSDQYPAAFDQISPTFYDNLTNIAISQAFYQNQMLNQRFGALRLGVRGFQAIGFSEEIALPESGTKRVLDPKQPVVATSEPTNSAWNSWAMATGIFGEIRKPNDVPNNRFDSGGFLFGIDHQFNPAEPENPNSPKLAVGLYSGYQYTDANAGTAGNTVINSALFGTYGTLDWNGFYANAIVGGGYHAYRSRRSIEFGSVNRTAKSSPDGGHFAAALNLGYDWKFHNFTFGPIAGFQTTYAGIAGFSESGADSLNLRLAQQDSNSIKTTLGARVAYTWSVTPALTVIPEIRLLWLHEYLDGNPPLSASLDGGSGASFSHNSAPLGENSAFAGAGITAQLGETWNASAFWNSDFANPNAAANTVSVTLGLQF